MRIFVRTVTATVVALAFGVGLLLALPSHAEASARVAPPPAPQGTVLTQAPPAARMVLAKAPASTPTARATKSKAAYKGAVNVNTASAAQLTLLPGIGPSKAQRIIAERKNKPFKRVEDLVRVKGIGPKTVKKLLPYLRVQGPTNFHRE